MVVDAILDVGCSVWCPENPFAVGLVLGEQKVRLAFAIQNAFAQFVMRRRDRTETVAFRCGSQDWFRLARPPGPGVAKPQRGQHVQLRGLRPAVARTDLDQDVIGTGLRVFDEHIEIPIVIEHARVEQLVLEVVAPALPVRFYQIAVRISALWIFVQISHV
jgi:hypothetical protein